MMFIWLVYGVNKLESSRFDMVTSKQTRGWSDDQMIWVLFQTFFLDFESVSRFGFCENEQKIRVFLKRPRTLVCPARALVVLKIQKFKKSDDLSFKKPFQVCLDSFLHHH